MNDKDLTFGPKKRTFKDLIGPAGTLIRVPFEAWATEILKDPMGPEALLARQRKDPDLEKVKIREIPIQSFLESPVLDVSERKILPPLIEEKTNLTFSQLAADVASKLGFRKESDGKSSKRGVIPKLDAEKNETSSGKV